MLLVKFTVNIGLGRCSRRAERLLNYLGRGTIIFQITTERTIGLIQINLFAGIVAHGKDVGPTFGVAFFYIHPFWIVGIELGKRNVSLVKIIHYGRCDALHGPYGGLGGLNDIIFG